jgi:hypothetical protein
VTNTATETVYTTTGSDPRQTIARVPRGSTRMATVQVTESCLRRPAPPLPLRLRHRDGSDVGGAHPTLPTRDIRRPAAKWFTALPLQSSAAKGWTPRAVTRVAPLPERNIANRSGLSEYCSRTSFFVPGPHRSRIS